MLIEFSVKNFGCIFERQTLSMEATRAYKDLEESNTFEVMVAEKPLRLLRTAVIYGPNAAGKSTLLKALSFMEDCVRNSARESQINDPIKTTHFRLNAAGSEGDSEFEVKIIEQGVRYHYGFACNRERFTEEWLFAYPKGQPQKYFHRVYDKKSKRYDYTYGSSLSSTKRKRKEWEEETRGNCLFLSKMVQSNNAIFKPVFDWFDKRFAGLDGAPSNSFTERHCLGNEAMKKRVLALMKSADLSIEDVDIEKRPFSREHLPDTMPQALRDELMRELEGKGLELYTTQFLHKDSEGNGLISFDKKEESKGTRTLFAFAGPWLDVMDKGRVLVVDELDASLHPLALEHLVRLMQTQGENAQLIFSTHNTSILSKKMLRPDQVWFMEKDSQQSAELYSLADFSVRENEAIERGYLNGRYGGIPILKGLDFYGQ